MRYKNSLLKKNPLDLTKYSNIKWENDLVIFEQDMENKDFWIKYKRYWQKIEDKHRLKFQETKDLFVEILDKNTNCEHYNPSYLFIY